MIIPSYYDKIHELSDYKLMAIIHYHDFPDYI